MVPPHLPRHSDRRWSKGSAPTRRSIRPGWGQVWTYYGVRATDDGPLRVEHGDHYEPLAPEAKINGITGVVTNGLFALRPADVLLLGTADGVKTLRPS